MNGSPTSAPPIRTWRKNIVSPATSLPATGEGTLQPKGSAGRWCTIVKFSMNCWEVNVKNLNEPRRDDELTTSDIANKEHVPQRPQVVPFGRGPTVAERTSGESLVPKAESDRLQARWDAIQSHFVDEPRKAVADADKLVAETVQRLAQIFADERSKLEQQLSRGEEISTEDLRLGL